MGVGKITSKRSSAPSGPFNSLFYVQGTAYKKRLLINWCRVENLKRLLTSGGMLMVGGRL